ncbi:TPA: ATPase V [Enterococcus faecalis]|nr:ATPase V [Enterococcus faecalis]
MDAIEKIISEIKQQGKQEIEAYVTSEQTRIDQEFQAAQQEILLKQEHEIEKRQQQLLKEFKQRQQRQTLEIRQDALNKKQAYLNQLFDEVVLKMSEWSAEEFQQFMKAQLGSLELTGKATILLGEYSQTKVTQEWLTALSDATVQWDLSEEVVPKESGFIVAKDGLDYNFLFSALVEEIQKTEGFKVAEKLFS